MRQTKSEEAANRPMPSVVCKTFNPWLSMRSRHQSLKEFMEGTTPVNGYDLLHEMDKEPSEKSGFGMWKKWTAPYLVDRARYFL